jgi:hypothetical protein
MQSRTGPTPRPHRVHRLCDDWFWLERRPCWNWGDGGEHREPVAPVPVGRARHVGKFFERTSGH